MTILTAFAAGCAAVAPCAWQQGICGQPSVALVYEGALRYADQQHWHRPLCREHVRMTGTLADLLAPAAETGVRQWALIVTWHELSAAVAS